MKRTDELTDAGGEAEREALRSFLRQWNVPGPPAEIEEDLRRTFRQRRRRWARRATWLSLAAALTMLGAGLLLRPPTLPLPARAPAASLSPPVSPPPSAAEADQAGAPAPTPVPAPGARRAHQPAPPAPRLVVESGQAELLWQYARALRRVRQAEPRPFAAGIEAPPADTTPPTPAFEDAAPFTQGGQGAAEWPSVGESGPTLGR